MIFSDVIIQPFIAFVLKISHFNIAKFFHTTTDLTALILSKGLFQEKQLATRFRCNSRAEHLKTTTIGLHFSHLFFRWFSAIFSYLKKKQQLKNGLTCSL